MNILAIAMANRNNTDTDVPIKAPASLNQAQRADNALAPRAIRSEAKITTVE